MDNKIENSGIYVAGGSINAENIVYGDNSKISKTIINSASQLEERGLKEISEKLSLLINEIELNREKPENNNELIAITESIATELKNNEPDRHSIIEKLITIKNGFASVTGIVNAVSSLKAAVELLL